MRKKPTWQLILAVFLIMGLAACTQQGEEEPSGDAPVVTDPMDSEAQSAAADDGQPGLPQIESGTAPAIISPELPPARPTTVGDRRPVSIADAVEAAPFTLLEPHDLPEDSHRDIVHLEVPMGDEEVPGLPSVRLTYTLGGGGLLIVTESPATGAVGAGEEVDINGNPGWVQQGEAVIVEWEQDGVRFMLRGTDYNIVLSAARSMGPLTDLDALP